MTRKDGKRNFFMTENKKEELKKKVIFLGLIIPVVIVIIGVSYAFFNVPVEKEEEKIVLTSGDLALTFKDNDDTVENIEGTWNFGDTIEKLLVIENTGTVDAYAKISWDNLINTYLAESLTYTLEEKSDEGNATFKKIKTANKNIPRSEIASTKVLANYLFIPAGRTNTYKLSMTLEDLAEVDQTPDLNAIFITKFALEQSQKMTAENILESLNIKINPHNPVDFSVATTTDETADGLFSMPDDYGTSYYYRGEASNNYVKFGKNAEGQDMWWRIIRFNGNGSMRIIYDGASTSDSESYTKDFALSNQPWNANDDDAKYTGWMFGGKQGEPSTSKEEAQRNETSTNVKVAVDAWYKSNIVDTGYHDYVSDEIFCNDRSFDEKKGTGYGNSNTYFKGRTRLVSDINPQLTCPQENDKFTVEEISGGNGALTYPVGLITADEIMVAGSGKYDNYDNYDTAINFYLKRNKFSWTFTPSHFSESGGFAFIIQNYLYSRLISVSTVGVLPVINIKSELVHQLQGNGTIDNPYVLQG